MVYHNHYFVSDASVAMVSILGLASNRGRNLRHIHQHRPGGATISAVVSNNAEAPILDVAADWGVPAIAVERKPADNRFDHERRILDAVSEFDIDLVCLDGYMRILSSTFLEAMPTTLNVHPSLLPSFPGSDAWGDALDAGVSVTGCTVHVVTDAVDEDGSVIEHAIDSGPIVTQEPIPVYAGDSRDALKERVLYNGEFKAYPRAVRWFAEDRIELASDGTVTVVEDTSDTFPMRRVTSTDRQQILRYGENPHQEAALYADITEDEPNIVHADQVAGEKGLSYVNVIDAAGALDLILEFERPAAAIIKHANPAGCATADSLTSAYERALATDPMSAFGGIVALNRPCDHDTAAQIVDSVKHVVVTPGIEEGVVETLQERPEMRVLDVSQGDPRPVGPADQKVDRVERVLTGGRLVQDRDLARVGMNDLEIVSDRQPTDDELQTMLFAWPVVKHATSNAIVFASGTETVGLGIGQVSRVDAVELAARKARDHATGKGPEGSIMASDAFFPFPDGIEAAAEAGVSAVIQPGGSTRDDEVISAADEAEMAMVFTGMRAFRHE